jgi:hypothetical protein
VSDASVSIDRSDMAGTPAALVIADDGTDYRFTEEGVGYVVQSVRVATAPDSADVDGSEVIAFARNATGLPLEFHVIGSSAADLASKIAEVEAALYRLDYPVTRDVEGVAKTYSGGPCALTPKRGTYDSGLLGRFFDTFAVTIPFPNPNSIEDES